MYKKSIVKGAIILTAANLITRVMGFFYRIYMSDAIGSEGIGLYQLVMPIYLLSWSITSSGFSTAVSRLTASQNAKKRFADTQKIIYVSVFMCILVSLVLSAVMFFSADFAAEYIIKDSRTAVSLKILAFAIPFMSAGSCIRGYFLGAQRQAVPAVSQILEQSIRIVSILVLAPMLASKGLEYACAAAVIGVLLGEAFSCIFTVVSYGCLKENTKNGRPSNISAYKCASLVLSMAVPLAATRISSSLLSAYENILIPQKLKTFGESAEAAMSIYGNLHGMVLPLIQLPSALLFALATAMMPTVAESAAVGNSRRISAATSKVFKFTFIVGIGTSCLFAVFPSEITSTVYGRYDLGVLLLKLVPICPLLYISIVINGILNGLGEHTFIFKNNIISSVINIAAIYCFMPTFGIDAYIGGLLVSLAFSTVSAVFKTKALTGVKLNITDIFIKPVMSAAAAGLLAKYILGYIEPSKAAYILAAVIMLAFYAAFLFACGALDRNDLKYLRY